jgi:hypothetical protein
MTAIDSAGRAKEVRWIRCFVLGWHIDRVIGSRHLDTYKVGSNPENDLPTSRKTIVMSACNSCNRIVAQNVEGHWDWPVDKEEKRDPEVERLRKMAGLE